MKNISPKNKNNRTKSKDTAAIDKRDSLKHQGFIVGSSETPGTCEKSKDRAIEYQIETDDYVSPTFKIKSNCPQGGDASHGGITVFSIENLQPLDNYVADYSIYIDREPLKLKRPPTEIKIVLRGDAECRTFIEGLKRAGAALEAIYLEQHSPLANTLSSLSKCNPSAEPESR
jgi:hypothetical protein